MPNYNVSLRLYEQDFFQKKLHHQTRTSGYPKMLYHIINRHQSVQNLEIHFNLEVGLTLVKNKSKVIIFLRTINREALLARNFIMIQMNVLKTQN